MLSFFGKKPQQLLWLLLGVILLSENIGQAAHSLALSGEKIAHPLPTAAFQQISKKTVFQKTKTGVLTVLKPVTIVLKPVVNVVDRILSFDTVLIKKRQTYLAKQRVKKAESFDQRVLESQGTINQLDLTQTSAKSVALKSVAGPRESSAKSLPLVTLGKKEIDYLRGVTKPLLVGMANVNLKVVDPVTGGLRHLTVEEVKIAADMVDLAGDALAKSEITLRMSGLGFQQILQNPEVSKAMLDLSGKPAAEFLKEYRLTVSALRAIDTAYQTFVHLPGKLIDPKLSKLVDSETMLTVAVRQRTPQEVVNAARTLTHEGFDHISHLWLDPLMRGDQKTETRLREVLKGKQLRMLNDEGKPALTKEGQPVHVSAEDTLDYLIHYRDHGSTSVFASRDGVQSKELEDSLRPEMMELTRTAAGKSLNTDFYAAAAEGSKESFLKIILLGTGIGFGIDHAAVLTGSPTLLKWKPTIVGGWDDFVGTYFHYKELADNGQNTFGDKANFVASNAFAVGTGVALGLGTFSGGRSLAELMLDPTTGLAGRVASGATYGVVTSAGSLAMSFLPARLRYSSIKKLVDEGKLAHPVNSAGRPLQGLAFKTWAAKEGLTSHLNYTVQKGGLTGVALSGVMGGTFGILPGWGGTAMANVLLAVAGSGETATLGGYLYFREGFDRRALKKATHQTLEKIARNAVDRPDFSVSRRLESSPSHMTFPQHQSSFKPLSEPLHELRPMAIQGP